MTWLPIIRQDKLSHNDHRKPVGNPTRERRALSIE